MCIISPEGNEELGHYFQFRSNISLTSKNSSVKMVGKPIPRQNLDLNRSKE